MTSQRDEEFIKFVEEKCESGKILILANVAKEYRENANGTAASQECLRKSIRKYSREEVREIQDEEKRAKQLFALSVEIDDQLMRKLQTHAHVKLDSKRKIIEYVSKDGNLTLSGDQSHAWKMKKVQERNRQLIATVKKEEESSDSDEDSDLKPPAPKKSRFGPTTRRRGDTSQMQSSKRVTQLEIEIEVMKKEAEKEKRRIENFQEEKRKNDVEILTLSTTLGNYRAADAKHKIEKQKSDEEKMEMKIKAEQERILHQTEIKNLKKEAANDLKKMEDKYKALVAELQAEIVHRTEVMDNMTKFSGELFGPKSVEDGEGPKEEEEEIEKESANGIMEQPVEEKKNESDDDPNSA